MPVRITRTHWPLLNSQTSTRSYPGSIYFSSKNIQQISRRSLHSRIIAPAVPKPTPFIPDVATFLTVIGRGLSQHASKIESWDALFRITSNQLRDLGVEPARSRKYLIRWREKYRHGEFGIGGDARHVSEGGSVECRLVEVPSDSGEAGGPTASLVRSAGSVRRVLNVPWTDPLGQSTQEWEQEKNGESNSEDKQAMTGSANEAEQQDNTNSSNDHAQTHSRGLQPIDTSILKAAQPIRGVSYLPGRGVHGSHVRLVRGTQGQVGIIEAREGIWEHRRGRKVDGGERRKAEVRFKRRSAERRAARG